MPGYTYDAGPRRVFIDKLDKATGKIVKIPITLCQCFVYYGGQEVARFTAVFRKGQLSISNSRQRDPSYAMILKGYTTSEFVDELARMLGPASAVNALQDMFDGMLA